MDQEKTLLGIPKPSLSVLLDVIAETVCDEAKEMANKTAVLQSCPIEYCYICLKSRRLTALYRKISKRIHRIELKNVIGLKGYRIANHDLTGLSRNNGIYCAECEAKYRINEYLKGKAIDKGLKINIYVSGKIRRTLEK